MGEAIGRMNRYADAFVSGGRYRWFVDDAGVHQEFTPYGPARPAHRQVVVVELCFYRSG